MARMWRPVWRSVLGSVARKYQNADPGVGGGVFTPASLFASGEQGAWYDPSDFSTMFQDSAGTTPVTAVEQPVGLGLDKRLGLVRGANNSLIASYKKDADGTSFVYLLDADASNAGKFFEVELEFVSPPTGGGLVQYLSGGTTYYFGAAGAGRWRGVLMGGTGALRIGGTTTDRLDVINISVRALPGNHASQTTAAARSVLKKSGAYYYRQSDGVDDSAATTTGGGASTAALIIMGFRTDAIGAAQTLFSDRSGNTGLKLEITAGGNIAFSGGNGASINTATGAAVAANTDYVVTANYDGTNLSVQLNNGTATTAACAVSAGTAAITFGKDNGAASGFSNGREYQTIYLKNVTKSAGEIASAKSYVAAKCGVTL